MRWCDFEMFRGCKYTEKGDKWLSGTGHGAGAMKRRGWGWLATWYKVYFWSNNWLGNSYGPCGYVEATTLGGLSQWLVFYVSYNSKHSYMPRFFFFFGVWGGHGSAMKVPQAFSVTVPVGLVTPELEYPHVRPWCNTVPHWRQSISLFTCDITPPSPR